MPAVRRVLHRRTTSLYARLPKCGNNAIRLMLTAQCGGCNFTDREMLDLLKPHPSFRLRQQSEKCGVVKVEGMPWDERQLPPGGSFKPVVVRNPKPLPTLCLPYSETAPTR